jgi:hypothetical protein
VPAVALGNRDVRATEQGGRPRPISASARWQLKCCLLTREVLIGALIVMPER